MDSLWITTSSDHLQILHAINKVQLCCCILFYENFFKVGSICRWASLTLWQLFVCFLCLRLFNISSICPRDVFDPVKCKTWLLFCDFLSLLFIDTILSVLHCLSFLKLSPLLLSCPKPLRVFESLFFRLVVFSCLYPSWSIFYPRLK